MVDDNFGSTLAKLLKQHSIESITDLGCGTGGYEKIISSVNIKIQGFDGNPETKTLDVSGGLCQGQTCKRCLTRFEIIDCYMTLVLLFSTQNIPIFS